MPFSSENRNLQQVPFSLPSRASRAYDMPRTPTTPVDPGSMNEVSRD